MTEKRNLCPRAVYFAAADLVVRPYREATGSGVLQLTFSLGVPVRI